MTRFNFLALVSLSLLGRAATAADEIPRPEHPTPDAVRPHWANLNGQWAFRFDPKDEGLKASWQKPGVEGFNQTITVPFPWESELSGIHKPNYHGIAWYRRQFKIPDDFPKDQRTWLRFGAVDWQAMVWVNDSRVTTHQGGYTPFEVDITEEAKLSAGKPITIVVRAFDPTDPSQPTGKQVGWYTTTSGIWQTVWLESRPKTRIDRWKVTTRFDPASATFDVDLSSLSAGKYAVSVRPEDAAQKTASMSFEILEGAKEVPRKTVHVPLPIVDAKPWSPESPHLYDIILELKKDGKLVDTVKTYFGLRTIARGKYGDAPFERILLNGKPVYLRTALDQSFNPRGIYTAPDDDFLKRDLLLAKTLGLNGLRIHIKPDEPRRLYWADKIGLLILEDMPNTWRQNAEARQGWEATMREVVARDHNHPSIFTWVAFNETWGLVSGSSELYKQDKDTQNWVARMVGKIRELDPTRLVEDNSPCNYDHVENTDLNSWHFYIDDHGEAKRHVDQVVAKTEAGSEFNYCPGLKQGTAPLINSEYGGVSAGSGDRDVSWSFRDLTTILRRQPKIQGYVYTELSDIEWEHNGFLNYDRSPKAFGYDAWLPDMRPNELNGADFIGYGGPPVIVAKPGEKVTVPVFLSHYSERGFRPRIRWWVSGWNENADNLNVGEPETRPANWEPFGVTEQKPVTFIAPRRPFVGSVNLVLRDEQNHRVAANYVNLVVKPEAPLPRVERQGEQEAVLRFTPGDFARQRWTGGYASPSGKAYGLGKGFFEYKIKVPASVVKAGPKSIFVRLEMASKAAREKVEWPERVNPQDYPQTDGIKWPSTLELALNGQVVDRHDLPDDPADAHGVLSHMARFEHGSYGELVESQVTLTGEVLKSIEAGNPLLLRISVPDDAPHAGGLCVFGSETGQYPFDPTITIQTRNSLPIDLGVKPSEPVAIDSLLARRTLVLGAGDSNSSTEWSYTINDPGKGWSDTRFDAAAWPRGRAGFGREGTPGLVSRTPWLAKQIWLRKVIDLPALEGQDALILRLFHDEDAEIYVNGKPLLKVQGYINGYRDLALSPDQKALFQPGENTIAATCRQTEGGQGIDVGLTLQRGN